jgi:hypothetical protein
VKRASLWLIVMTACSALSIGLLVVTRPDEAESIMRRHGRLHRQYVEGGSAFDDGIQLTTRVEGDEPKVTAIYNDLLQAGWTPWTKPARNVTALVRPSDDRSAYLGLHRTPTGEVEVIRNRPATGIERLVHRVKTTVGIDDTTQAVP